MPSLANFSVYRGCRSATALLLAALFVGSESRRIEAADHIETASETALEAGRILNEYCYRCHRGSGSSSGRFAFNVRRAKSMIDSSVVTEKDAASQLILAIQENRMPPPNQGGLPRPSPKEFETLQKWIDDGAIEFPLPARRPFVGLNATLQAILNHFQKLPNEVRRDYRYFTLTHLHNDPLVDSRQLRMVRAGLAKALNSLTWEKQIAVPEVVPLLDHDTPANGLVYAIDLKRLGWTRQHWNEIINEYPYFVSGEDSADSALRTIERDLAQLGGGDKMLKHVRADWFVTTSLQPKLYHKLLYELSIPELRQRHDDPKFPANPKQMTDLDLEKFLSVNVREGILGLRPTAKRTGYAESLISGQNRMIERHPLTNRQGAYWKSYDFLGSNARSILAEFPLGPKLGDQRFDPFSFEHDGGEIIFTLPNGLQGYLLANSAGTRLDAGPIEIVGDALKTSGNQLIVSGLSCIVCHRKGMVDPPGDEIRQFANNFGNAGERILALYPQEAEMSDLVAGDSENFSTAIEPLLKPFLIVEDDSDRSLDELPEPVGETSRRFLLEPLTADIVAAELYLSEAQQKDFRDQLRLDSQLKELGLGVLSRDNGTIKRAIWQSRSEGRSLMQIAASITDSVAEPDPNSINK